MALQLSLSDTSIGVAFPEAYAKIGDYFGNKNTIQYQVAVWANAAAREANCAPVRSDAYYVEVADLTGDVMPALYADLKTHEPYTNGVDI
jgi:hypothetical protein